MISEFYLIVDRDFIADTLLNDKESMIMFFPKISLNVAAIWCSFIMVEFSLKLNNVSLLGPYLQLLTPFI